MFEPTFPVVTCLYLNMKKKVSLEQIPARAGGKDSWRGPGDGRVGNCGKQVPSHH